MPALASVRDASVPSQIDSSRAALDACIAWSASRAALVLVTLFATAFGGHWRHHGATGWNHWDATWYVRIATEGYATIPSASFFPVFPALTGGVARLLTGGGRPGAALVLGVGMTIANLCTLAALIGLAALVAEVDSGRVAVVAVRLLVAFPLAFFLAACYTDGPFLALAVLALLAARRRAWGWAALAALAAAPLRPSAPILVLPLLWEFGAANGWRLPRGHSALLSGAALALAVPAGLGLYAGYLWWRFGDPLLFVHSQASTWHHAFLPFWQTIGLALAHQSVPMAALDLALVIAFALGALLMLGRLRFSMVLYTVSLLLLILSAPQPAEPDVLNSAGRYLLAAFPVFWLGARWLAGRPWAERSVLFLSAAVQAVLAVVFLSGGPVF